MDKINKYNKLYSLINKKLDLTDLQIITSDLSLCDFLFYIQKNNNINLNIILIRKNRSKTSTYSKLEGKLNSKKILVIENYDSNLNYIEKSLELEKKKIEYIFIISKLELLSYIEFYNKNTIFKNNLTNTKLIYSTTNQNLRNLYKKNFIQVIEGNLLILDDLGVLVLLSENYKELWRCETYNEFKISLRPIIIQDKVFLVTSDGNLLIISLLNGRILSNISICDNIFENMYFLNNQLYIIGINASINNNNTIYILDINTLSLKEYLLDGNVISNGICIVDELFYFGNNREQLVITNLIFFYYFNLEGNIIGGITFHGNIAYFGTDLGFLYGFDASSNKIIYKNKLSKYWILTKPLIVKDKLYLTSVDKKLYILDLSLNFLGNIYTGGRIFGNPVYLLGKYIAFGSNDCKLYIYNIENKKVRFFQFSERIIANPTYKNDKIVIQDFLNNIYECKL